MFAAAVGEILIAMFYGLAIGIVSLILYYFFSNRLSTLLTQTEDLVEEFDLLAKQV